MTSKGIRLILGLGAIVLVATLIVATSQRQSSPSVNDIAVAIDVVYAFEGEVESDGAATAAIGPCEDPAFALAPWRLKSDWPWVYNPAGTPGSVAAGALSTIQRGIWTMFTGSNHCGISTTVSFRERYQGLTALRAQIGSSGTCTGNDGRSVISWGVLPDRVLAYTCTHYRKSTGVMVESDTLLSVRFNWFVGNIPPNCSAKFDLESVIVHESGHVIGLAHVGSGSGPLVMSPRTQACTIGHRRLGLGDVNGRRVIVG